MENITDIFIDLIQQHPSIDIAESEFKRLMADDAELHTLYRQWCREVGSSEKRGFLDFCDEYLDGRNEIWDSLSDYDDVE